MSVAAHIEVSLYICQLSGWNLCTYVLLHDPAAIPCIGKDQFAIYNMFASSMLWVVV